MSFYDPEKIPGKREKSDLNTPALLSFLFAISGLWLPAIILGHVGSTQIRRRLETGKVWATLGLLLGYLQGLLVLVIVLLYIGAATGLIANILPELTRVGPGISSPLPSATFPGT